MLLWVAVIAVAQTTTNSPPFDPNTAALPVTKEDFWNWGIALATPAVIWLIGKVPSIPRPVLPFLGPLLGIVLAVIGQKLGGMNLSWWDGAKYGALATTFREMFNQVITKQLKPLEASKTKTAPVDKAVAVHEGDLALVNQVIAAKPIPPKPPL